MEFTRARTSEQRAERVAEIVNAAIEIHKESGRDRINFLEISKRTQFTRPAIYKYFNTKEEIMLRMILHYISQVIGHFEESTADGNACSKSELADKLTAAMLSQPAFMELYSILFTIIEKNVSLEALVQFKKELYSFQQPMLDHLQRASGCRQKAVTYRFMVTYFSAATGLYSMCFLSDIQLKAIRVSQTGYVPPVFADSFQKTLELQLTPLYEKN